MTIVFINDLNECEAFVIQTCKSRMSSMIMENRLNTKKRKNDRNK